ncbi:MAG: hypothetical protein ABEI98_10500 [Halorhabdus sp.]
MSASEDSDETVASRREVAYRLFATEFDDATYSYSESDEERAPNYVVTPTGGRVNRVFVVGVLTEVQPAGEDVLRARIADPTGTFVVYAGQYQPDAQTFLERAEPPAYVAVTGKARTFQPEDSEVVYTSIRPESLNEVDAATRDRWTVATARQTLERVGAMATAMELDAEGDALTAAIGDQGVDESLADGISLALSHYSTTPGYLAAVRDLAISAAELVAGEREEVESLGLSPNDGGEAELDALAETAELATSAGAASNGATTGTTPSTAAEETPPATDAATDTDASTATDTPKGETTSRDEQSEPSEAESDDTEPGEEPVTAGHDDTARAGAPEPAASGESDGLGDFDGEFELDEDEREEIKSEFGTEFTSGTDVGEPGQANIETPEPDAERVDATDDGVTDRSAETTAPTTATEESEPVDEVATDETAQDDATVDLEDAVMDAMNDLDDGDGADRTAVIDRVSDDQGVSDDAVEDAIKQALMNGRCYEPDEGVLKPI